MSYKGKQTKWLTQAQVPIELTPKRQLSKMTRVVCDALNIPPSPEDESAVGLCLPHWGGPSSILGVYQLKVSAPRNLPAPSANPSIQNISQIRHGEIPRWEEARITRYACWQLSGEEKA